VGLGIGSCCGAGAGGVAVGCARCGAGQVLPVLILKRVMESSFDVESNLETSVSPVTQLNTVANGSSSHKFGSCSPQIPALR
jgi:hypothetical protein